MVHHFITRHARQGLKFAVSGGLGAVVDFGGLFLLQHAVGLEARHAVVLSIFPALIVVFLMNKYFTFRDSKAPHGKQAAKFAAVYALAILWNIILSLVFLSVGLPAPVAKALAIACVSLWNYTLLHGFVFRRHA
jgi:putative flippase GtrA